jgi:hypothetical protein
MLVILPAIAIGGSEGSLRIKKISPIVEMTNNECVIGCEAKNPLQMFSNLFKPLR